MDPATAAAIQNLRTAALLANSRRKKSAEDEDLEVDVEGGSDKERGKAGEGEGGTTGGGGAAGGETAQQSTTTPASLPRENRKDSDKDEDDDVFSLDTLSGARRRDKSPPAQAGSGGVEEQKGEGRGPEGGRAAAERPRLAQPWTQTVASRTATLDPPAVSNFGFDDEDGGGA